MARDIAQIANISSGQIEAILDDLIGEALKAINDCTGLAREMVATLVVQATLDVRRRPARRDGFQAAAVRFMLMGDSASLLDIKLNHDHAINICNRFLELTSDVNNSTMQCLIGDAHALTATGLSISATNYGKLFTASRTVKHALNEFLEFRGHIANKYERLASQKAKEASMARVGTSYHTAFSQARMAVLTGIDRYSSTRGALASYIDVWIKQALFDKGNLQEGVAFDIESDNTNGSRDAALRLHSTRSVPLDDLLLETIAAAEAPVGTNGGEHTRALSRLRHLRPALRACGASLSYQMTNRERKRLVRIG